MFKKKCANCGIAIEKHWNFCPVCGLPMGGQAPAVSSINIDLNNLNKVFQPMINSLMGGMMGGVFQNQQQAQKEKANLQEKFTKNLSSVNEVVEPEDSITDNGETTTHSVNLPGVKSKSDINVTKMENSIEVRALSGRRLYLKIIKREKGQGILSEQFTKENLILVMKKL